MARRRHTPEQIIRKLAEGQKLLAGGMDLEGVCRQHEIAESTWARWLAQYGGVKADAAKRPQELEGENARVKKHLAHAERGKSLLKELGEGHFCPRPGSVQLPCCVAHGGGSPTRGE